MNLLISMLLPMPLPVYRSRSRYEQINISPPPITVLHKEVICLQIMNELVSYKEFTNLTFPQIERVVDKCKALPTKIFQ